MIAMPAPRAPQKTPSTFTDLLSEATRSRGSKTHALNLGITREALIRYADGAVFDEGERCFIEGIVATNEWSRRVVVERVKSQRGKKRKRVAA